MPNTLMQLSLLVVIFLCGVVLRKAWLLGDRHSSFVLRFVFYIGLPVVIFLAVLRVGHNGDLLHLAFLPFAVVIVTLCVMLVLKASLLKKVKMKTFAAMLAGASILNIGFLYPFVQAYYGADGLAQLAVIDCFNVMMIFSVLYAVIAGLTQRRPDMWSIVKRMASAPTLWALMIGIVFRVDGLHLPQHATDFFEPAAVSVSWMLLFALGLKFKWQLKNPPLFLLELVLRLGLGAVIGICLIKLFQLHGLDAQILMIASMAPIGLNSITLAEIEKLDVEFAVSSVSAGLVVGMVMVPVMIQVVQAVQR